MRMMTKKMKLKIVAIDCSHFCMRVWSKVCNMLSLMMNVCRRNKMYKTVRILYRLYNKAFAMHDIWYRKTKSMCEAVLAQLEE